MDRDTLRILDANLNRAREALRVIEEHARFVLNDAAASAAVKDARHEMRRFVDAIGAADEIGADGLLAARSIESDVGREVKTADELTRGSTDDVVRAAFARLTEAARVLGEYGKLVSPEAAKTAEAVRYRAYELEQRIVLRGGLRKRFRACRLYVIVTEGLCRGDWLDTAAAAIRVGARCVQLREKPTAERMLGDAELLARARQLREVTRKLDTLFIINDRPDIARLAGADGVHVGQNDLSVREARRIGGGHMLVGKSTHTVEQFEAALAEEPDYIAVGPIYPSATKPQEHIAGLDTLREATRRTEIPIVAVGGINAENAGDVFAAGANTLCVCSAVIGVSEPHEAARLIRSAMRA